MKKGGTTGIPGTEDIVSDAWKAIMKKFPEKTTPEYVEKHFSEVCLAYFDEAHTIYKKHEGLALDRLADRVLEADEKEVYTRDEVRRMARSITLEASEFEKSLKQSRAARAGRTFEIIVSDLLKRTGIPNERVTKEDKASGLRRIDLVVPDKKTAIKDMFAAKFLSLKTSLKDRWKLVGPDQMQGQRTFLVTILQNESLTKEVAKKIKDAGIRVYVPDGVKKDFADNDAVRKLSDLPRDLR